MASYIAAIPDWLWDLIDRVDLPKKFRSWTGKHQKQKRESWGKPRGATGRHGHVLGSAKVKALKREHRSEKAWDRRWLGGGDSEDEM